MLCSKSAWAEGRRQVGAVHVACRIWARCRSLTPGSCPAASNRWSQVWVAIGSSANSRSRCPAMPVVNRQAPYPPGGPCSAGAGEGESWPVAAGLAGRVGSAGRVRSAGRPGFSWFRRAVALVLGCEPGAAVPDCVSLPVGYRQAPGGLGVGGGGAGQVAGEPRVDRAQARDLPGPVRETEQRSPAGPSGAAAPRTRSAARPPPAASSGRPDPAGPAGPAGPAVRPVRGS